MDLHPETRSTCFDPVSGLTCTAAGSGRPLVFLHGLFDASCTWRRLFVEMASDGQLLAPDLPGFGRSRLPLDWGESIQSMVDRLLLFIDGLEEQPLVLVGNSMGGGLALALAAARPDGIERLVLVNPYALPTLPLAVRVSRLPLAAWIGPFLLTPLFRRAMIRRIFLRSLHDPMHLSSLHLQEVSAPLEDRDRRGELIRFLRHIDIDAMRRIDRMVPELPQKVLLIWGENDGWLGMEHADRLESRLRHCFRVNLPNCGHLAQVEKPSEIGRAIRTFLERE